MPSPLELAISRLTSDAAWMKDSSQGNDLALLIEDHEAKRRLLGDVYTAMLTSNWREDLIMRRVKAASGK